MDRQRAARQRLIPERRQNQKMDERPKVPMVRVPAKVKMATIRTAASGPVVRTEDATDGIDYFCPSCGRTLLENIEIGTIQLAVKCFDCQTVSMPPV